MNDPYSTTSAQEPTAPMAHATAPWGAVNATDTTAEAAKAVRIGWICAVIGLFVLGIVLGFVAVGQARKAEQLGRKATALKVFGILDVILAVMAMTVFRKQLGF